MSIPSIQVFICFPIRGSYKDCSMNFLSKWIPDIHKSIVRLIQHTSHRHYNPRAQLYVNRVNFTVYWSFPPFLITFSISFQGSFKFEYSGGLNSLHYLTPCVGWYSDCSKVSCKPAMKFDIVVFPIFDGPTTRMDNFAAPFMFFYSVKNPTIDGWIAFLRLPQLLCKTCEILPDEVEDHLLKG